MPSAAILVSSTASEKMNHLVRCEMTGISKRCWVLANLLSPALDLLEAPIARVKRAILSLRRCTTRIWRAPCRNYRARVARCRGMLPLHVESGRPQIPLAMLKHGQRAHLPHTCPPRRF